ncbi:hypothetical protein Tco_0658336 [Tanacetum coccineum]
MEVVMGGNSLVLTFYMGIGVEKPGGGVISLSFVMPEKHDQASMGIDNKNENTTLSEAQGVSLQITSGVRIIRRRPPAKVVGLRVADSHTGNHREDDFTPLKTIRRFSSIIWEKIPFELKGEASKPEKRPSKVIVKLMAYHHPNDISQADIPLDQQPPFSNNNSTGKDHWLNSAILRQQNSNIFLNLQTNNNNLDSASSQHHLHTNNNNQWLSRPILHRNISNVTGVDHRNDFNDHSRNIAAGQV